MNEQQNAETRRIMIDLETMGTGPRAAIVAVGAVMFSLSGLGRTFYRRVDLASAMACGLVVDAETIRWWLRQGEAARDEVARLPGGDLAEVLYDLEQWMTDDGDRGPEAPLEPVGPVALEVWGNGAVSDPVWLASAYEACGFEVPWRHYQVRCFRTLRELLPWVPRPRRPETAHHALQDAEYQATYAGALLRELERMWPPAVAVSWGAVAESHEAPCAHCGDTGTAAEPDGAGGWRPTPCGCWLGRAGVAAAEAIRRVPLFPGGPSVAAPCVAGADLSVSNSTVPAAASGSAKTATGINGGSGALCAAAPGESSVLARGVSSLPRRFWTRKEED